MEIVNMLINRKLLIELLMIRSTESSFKKSNLTLNGSKVSVEDRNKYTLAACFWMLLAKVRISWFSLKWELTPSTMKVEDLIMAWTKMWI